MKLRRIMSTWLDEYAKTYAHVAQLVEHVIGNDEVAGSIPAVGSHGNHRHGFSREEGVVNGQRKI